MDKQSKIYVAGHTGLAGSAIGRELERRGYSNVIGGCFKNGKKVDLRREADVLTFFEQYQPEYVFMAAAHAGGIQEAIGDPVRMLSDNLQMQTNLINACYGFDVKKLLFLGSSCVYPVDATQPYKEECLGSGKTDENWSYAVAKIAGIELCRAYNHQYDTNYMCVMPCNLYGINDRFGENAHVIPSLIRKFHEGGTVSVWGNWTDSYYSPMREFLYADDLAEACVMLMEEHSHSDLCDGVINIGQGHDVELRTLLHQLERIVGKRKIVFDASKPMGVRSKLLDVKRIRELGWRPKTDLYEGLERVSDWYQRNNI